MSSSSESDLVLQAARLLIEGASEHGLRLRAFGGIAVRIRCPQLVENGFGSRVFKNDIDLVGDSAQMLAVDDFLRNSKFLSAGTPNYYAGGDYWGYEYRPNNNTVITLGSYFGKLRFNHPIPFPYFHRDSPYTIPLTQLLLSKLSIVELKHKDFLDLYSILAEHPIGTMEASDEVIHSPTLQHVWGKGLAGWRLSKTCGRNLESLRSSLSEFSRTLGISKTAQQLISTRLITLQELLEASPKTKLWRIRQMMASRGILAQRRWFDIVKPPEDVPDG